jgi:hypothetical protein
MTNGAALGLHGEVLKYERTLCIVVALEADLILSPTGSQLPWQKCAVRIVAVIAGNQSFVNPMPIRPAEFGSLLSVALIAEKRCLLDQKRAVGLGMVRGMTVETADAVCCMR